MPSNALGLPRHTVAYGWGRESDDSSADRCGGSAGRVRRGCRRHLPASRSTAACERRREHQRHRVSVLRDCSQPVTTLQSKIPSTSHMAAPFTIDQIAERVERLLLRHAELRRTNALLAEQVAALTQERDALKSRLNAARARVDALLERLPAAPSRTKEAK